MTDFNDEPISHPDEDMFGFDPFARSISECIKRLRDPVGSVVAIHGPWGSGKSSVVNLVRHHLRETDPKLNIVPFQCWLYRTEDALAVGFFKELYAGLSPALSDSGRSQKALRKLGVHVAGAGGLLGVVVGAAAGSLWGKIITSASGVLENYIKTEDGTEALQREVAGALKKSNQRFLVVVDDIDRLSPEEALVIFRLIKSVGRLPNVTYLLAYDRETTEKAVGERYPSEGPHYLEKIIQAGFELPEPSMAHLIAMLRAKIDQIFNESGGNDPVHLGNLFHEIVVPEIITPRDVHRLANTLSVTYQAVEGEVNTADFLGLETLRLFRPSVYRAIRLHNAKLVGVGQHQPHANHEQVSQTYENIFLKNEPNEDRPRLKDALMRLFPRLQSVWLNMHYPDDKEWSQQRRACSAVHFDTYFRFSLSPHTIRLSEIQAFVNRADDREYVRSQFLEALGKEQADGRTKVSFLLDEMNCHSESIPVDKVGQFLGALYSIADDLNVEADEERGFAQTNNRLRLHWLTRALLWDRTELAERSAILLHACEEAALAWLVDISASAYHDYHPREEGAEVSPPEKCLMTEGDAKIARDQALSRVRDAANDGTLLNVKGLASVLFRWHEMVGGEAEEIREFCGTALDTDQGVAILARAFLDQTYSHAMGRFGGLGDLVYRNNDRAQVDGIEMLLDSEQFRARLAEVVQVTTMEQNDAEIVRRLIKAWDARDQGDD